MEELIKKYREQHKDVPRDWKIAVINKVKKDPTTYIDIYQDIDWLYDECIYYLFDKTTRKIQNLAKKEGYSEIPCETCRLIIKHWNDSDEYMWAPEHEEHFKT